MTSTTDSLILERLRRIGLSPKDSPGHSGKRRASVLVPLFYRKNGWYVLLTQRPLTIRTHAGEVCFPGGKQDPEDDFDDVRTALRETHEEVGIDPKYVKPICRLETMESVNGLCVTPVVGIIEPSEMAELESLTLSPGEVEAAFYMPLAYFVHERNLVSKERIAWSGDVFIMRVYLYQTEFKKTFKVWGLTAHVAYTVAEIALAMGSESDTPSSDPPRRREGYIYIQKEGRTDHWLRRYAVYEHNVLHWYGSEGQAKRKANSASKKNRLLLRNMKVSASQNCGAKFPFKITLHDSGTVWTFAAESGNDRSAWVYTLNSS